MIKTIVLILFVLGELVGLLDLMDSHASMWLIIYINPYEDMACYPCYGFHSIPP